MAESSEIFHEPRPLADPALLPAPEEHALDIHKPKPVHGWREFLSEIGTIICGILIALSLEQVVSTFDWNRKVAETREAVGLELGENLGKMELRLRLEQCVNQRLDAIANIVDQAAKTGSLPPLPILALPPYTTWGSGVWNSAVSAQTASHLPADELRRYGRFYAILGVVSAAEPQEEGAWTILYELAGPGRSFDMTDARTYRRAIGQARQFNALIAGFSVRGEQAATSHHMQFDHKVFTERAALSNQGEIDDCGAPKGTPPTTYGAAPAVGFSRIARAHLSPSDK